MNIHSRFVSLALMAMSGAVSVIGSAAVDDKLPPEPTPLMCKKGDLILKDSYADGKHGKEWFRITGKFDVVNGRLKCAETAKDNHHSELSTGATGILPGNNYVIRFSFKFDGAKSLSVGLENPKGHVARAGATPEEFGISRWQGKKDARKVKLQPGTWHTVLWEVHGSEMVAQLDDHPPLYVEDDGLKVDRTRLVLTNYGQFAWFGEVAIWKAELDDQWPARRARLKEKQGK